MYLSSEKTNIKLLGTVFITLCCLASQLPSEAAASRVFPSSHGPIQATTLKSDLHHPWGMAFINANRVLITERRGRLLALNLKSKHTQVVRGLPRIIAQGQGGLLDVAIDPQFEKNRWVYISYTGGLPRSKSTHVGRGKLQNGKLNQFQVIFKASPLMKSQFHFGSRLVFSNQGHLYISLGERGQKSLAQDPSNHSGSMIRVWPDGSVPADNPFLKQRGYQPSIFSYGHRNMQGAALHPTTGEVWAHEHGPKGGDEINVIRPGRNYGWPKTTYGIDYDGTIISTQTTLPGITSPIHHWTPSIAPSGMAFVKGPLFSKWRGDLLVGALKDRRLMHLTIRGEQVLEQEPLLGELAERIRDVEIGPSGAIYLLTDSKNGSLLKLTPQQ
ncbi:MAG: PQQ-dependent sugar dehydrogenase [Deltaproteobacteria bacterium]|nr:PQQ-dependent sugar dehydrogenase [Deltaproteobacteria bacterium]MBT6432883.1 PQQ-dependent sugar dehydrogenase [Deltaproteobacteria bacterium]MBT6489890.1 PQQ-dependent sugar dehydrogenase [Deltaproteobacteria bacterium]